MRGAGRVKLAWRFSKTYFLSTRFLHPDNTAQKMRSSIKDFFSKCDQICRKLRI